MSTIRKSDAFAARSRFGFDAQEDAALFRELDRVAHEIEQDLAQPVGISHHLVGDMARHMSRELDTLHMGARREELGDVLGDVEDRERFRLQTDGAGFDLGVVEDLIDDGEERAARSVDGRSITALLGRELGLEKKARHADDAVHGRADLVAHRGEEARLGDVGGLGIAAGLLDAGEGTPERQESAATCQPADHEEGRGDDEDRGRQLDVGEAGIVENLRIERECRSADRPDAGQENGELLFRHHGERPAPGRLPRIAFRNAHLSRDLPPYQCGPELCTGCLLKCYEIS